MRERSHGALRRRRREHRGRLVAGAEGRAPPQAPASNRGGDGDLTSDGVATSQPWFFKWREQRCYRRCRQCYQRHPVLLPAARGVAAGGGWCFCRRQGAAMLPAADGDATCTRRRCSRHLSASGDATRRRDGVAAAIVRRCYRHRAVMLPSPIGDATTG
jgi:hypothetical protein